MDIALYTNILYYYQQPVQMNCTSVYTTHINGKHTNAKTLHFMYIDSCTNTLYYCTQLVQMDCTYVYKNLCTHYASISCTAVRLYCSPFTEELYCKFVLTNESPSDITFMTDPICFLFRSMFMYFFQGQHGMQ